MKTPLSGLVAFALLLVVTALAAPDPALLQKAQAGNAEAQLEVFGLLVEEAETPEAYAAAEKYLRAAATSGYAPAQLCLAGLLSEQDEAPETLAEAAGWYRKAADQGIEEAQETFGSWAAGGRGVERDPALAVRYWKMAALQGNHDALSCLVKLYAQGEDYWDNKYPVDLREAIKWQEKIALAPEAPGYQRMALARMYLEQPKVPAADRAMAEKIVREEMADGGSIDEAMRALLGEAVANEVAPKDPMVIWRRRALAGDPASQLHYFNLVEEASPLEPAAMNEAYAFLVQAAKGGLAPAQYRLGKFLSDLHPVNGAFADPDPVAAAGWFRQAAEQKHVDAMLEWALVQARGEGVPKDLAGAVRVMREAALAGNPAAQLYLSNLYQNGEDPFENKVLVDLAEAARWQRLLVKAGDQTAYATYGEILAKLPNPDAADLAEALKLLEEQVAGGIENSQDALNAVRRKMGLPVAAPVATVAAAPAPVAPASIPVADPKQVEQRYEARFTLFQENFNAARNAVGREASVRRLREWIELEAPYTERLAAGAWFLKRLAPELRRHPSEAFSLLVEFPQTIISDAMIQAEDSALFSAVRDGARRASEAYQADEKQRDVVRRHHEKARAGDGPAQLATGLAYLGMTNATEKQWPYAVYWLEKAHAQNVPGAYEPLRNLVDRVNARMRAAGEAKDLDTLVEMHWLKAYSPMADADVSAYTAGALLLDEGYGLAEDISLASVFLRMAADKGHVDAMLQLGQLYVLHQAQPIDETQALFWFGKAAAAGSKEAEAWVKVLTPALDPKQRGKLAMKIGGERMGREANVIDFGPATPFASFAARLGNADAMAFLATSYLLSDVQKATELYHQAAEGGSVSAMSFLATAYARGEGVAKDRAQARAWRLKAAAAGGMWEKNAAGVDLQRGTDGPIDFVAARDWFLQAAALGQFEAMYHLGEIWFDGKDAVGTEQEAVAWWTKAAEGGIEEAQYRLGLLYRDGRGGVTKDLATARRWIGAAALQDYAPAKAALQQLGGSPAAPVARDANDVKIDEAFARIKAGLAVPGAQRGPTTLEQDQAGAASGDAESINRLAERYETGDGVSMSAEVALDWYRKAAALGHADARKASEELDRAINRNAPVTGPKPTTIAEDLRGSSEGNPESIYRFGQRYEKGDGVDQNLQLALAQYRKAEALGHEEARLAVLRLTLGGGHATFVTGTGKGNEVSTEKPQPAPSADGALANARMFAGMGLNEDAQKMLMKAVSIAETGSAATKHQLATMLFQGSLGVGKDPARAVKLLADAADAGHIPAQVDYGHVLTQGAFGIPANAVKGQKYLQMAVAAADTGSAEGKVVTFGLLYQGAPGIPADPARAVRLLREAADSGLAVAQFQYASALFQGTPEITRDPVVGFEYLKKAADQRLPQAMFLLGQAYESGTGTAVNFEEARRWYGLAETAKVPGAKEAHQRMNDAAPSLFR